MKTPVEEQAYLDRMEWKRKVHAACGTKLIESYSWWNKDQDLLNKLEALLRTNGVTLSIDPQRNAAEYQDTSLSRFGLLSAIRDATGAKLMCVGDDWQAIYRFAGSDVTLFTNFGRLVGFYEEMRIERTYRNSQALVDVASEFVLKGVCGWEVGKAAPLARTSASSSNNGSRE